MEPNVKVAQPGWNVNTAPDWALVFSSQWPSLQIAFEETITIPANTTASFTINHNLNYIPVAMAWISSSTINYGRVPTLEVTDTIATGLALATPNSSFPENITITLRCYNVDVTKEAVYPLPQSASVKQAPDYQTSIKIVKENPTRQISSTNMNDFILNSQCQSPAVLEVTTQSGQYANLGTFPYTITYPLQTNYIPWVLGALGLFGNTAYQYFPTIDLQYISASNSLQLKFGAAGNVASLIVLRDPLFYPNTVRVVY